MKKHSALSRFVAALFGVLLAWLGVDRAIAQTYSHYSIVHSFGSTVINSSGSWGPDGVFSHGATVDAAGNIFGVTAYGGSNDIADGGDGVVWEITKSGTYRDLHDFGGLVLNSRGKSEADGYFPNAGVTVDSSGNVFGTTEVGGANGWGIVWQITAAGVYTDLHDFGGVATNLEGASGPDGELPESDVTVDSQGNLYGTASRAGVSNSSWGIVWKLTKAGVYTDLHDFGGTITYADGKTGPDGFEPWGAVVFDKTGNMYGTTTAGGEGELSEADGGIVWEITSSRVYKDLHSFGPSVTYPNGSKGPDGEGPGTRILVDPSGNLYGTTAVGGPVGQGTAWKITSAGIYHDLHNFGGTVVDDHNVAVSDGLRPRAPALDSAGDLLGAAGGGGASGNGMIWVITATGAYEDLYDFGGTVKLPNGDSVSDGQEPMDDVGADSSGNLCGTALWGGQFGEGIVWKLLRTPRLWSFALNTPAVTGGSSCVGVVGLDAPAPAGGLTVTLSSSSPKFATPTKVTIAAGHSTSTYPIPTSSVSTTTIVTFKATLGSVTKEVTLSVKP